MIKEVINLKEEPKIYNIPGNYKNPGKWRSLPIPNLIEGIVVGFIFESLLMKIPFTFQFRIVALVVTFAAILLVFIRGVNGERISFFILSFFKYLWKIVSNKYKYHMRKVGVKDVEALENRNSSTGKQNNFTKLVASFKKRKATEDN